MLAGTDWSALTVAGGFVVGAALGMAATVRLVRYLLDYLRDERRSK